MSAFDESLSRWSGLVGQTRRLMVIFPATVAVAWLGCRAVESSLPSPAPARADLIGAMAVYAPARPDPLESADPDVEPEGLLPAALVRTVAGDQPPREPPAPRVRHLRLRVTAYCPCPKCCGRWSGKGLTASGSPITANGGLFVAADTNLLPFGTKVRVPGYADGRAVPVLDRGGAIRGHRMEVFFQSHQVARQWGVQWLTVEVLQE